MWEEKKSWSHSLAQFSGCLWFSVPDGQSVNRGLERGGDLGPGLETPISPDGCVRALMTETQGVSGSGGPADIL